MIMPRRKVILYIAASIDGYIATKDGNIDFLKSVHSDGEDYGYGPFIKTVDTVIMGRKTYDKILSFAIDWPHGDKKCYVLSRSKSGRDENVHFYNGSVSDLIHNIRKETGLNIYCDGGSDLVYALMQAGLIDQFVISVIPCLLGNGIKLFRDGTPANTLQLKTIKSFKSGLVQACYERAKS